MNKINRLILVGLMFFGVHNACGMGQEQREILYTLHALEQDFAQLPMITQNIDMFLGVMEMNIQLTEIQLKNANQKLKTILLKNAAVFTGALLGRTWIVDIARGKGFIGSKAIAELLINGGISLGALVGTLNALNIHDAWKKRSELQQSLALDKEILSKLQETKDMIGNSQVAEKFLSEKATISSLGE